MNNEKYIADAYAAIQAFLEADGTEAILRRMITPSEKYICVLSDKDNEHNAERYIEEFIKLNSGFHFLLITNAPEQPTMIRDNYIRAGRNFFTAAVKTADIEAFVKVNSTVSILPDINAHVFWVPGGVFGGVTAYDQFMQTYSGMIQHSPEAVFQRMVLFIQRMGLSEYKSELHEAYAMFEKGLISPEMLLENYYNIRTEIMAKECGDLFKNDDHKKIDALVQLVKTNFRIITHNNNKSEWLTYQTKTYAESFIKAAVSGSC